MKEFSVNIEIVKGCNNTNCKSWNTTCIHDGNIILMSNNTLDNIVRQLQDRTIKTLSLFGLGEPLIRNDLEIIIKKLQDLNYKNLQVNTDAHMFNIITSALPRIDVLAITHKDDIVDTSFAVKKYTSKVGKLAHVFILSQLTKSKLLEIDEYIDTCFNFHERQTFGIQPMWSCLFDKPMTKNNIDFVIEDGIEIVGEPVPSTEVSRAYFCVDGSIKKCFFSNKILNNIDDAINNTETLCATCLVRGQAYEILTKGGDNNEI
jgi:organic radical activating enzyme